MRINKKNWILIHYRYLMFFLLISNELGASVIEQPWQKTSFIINSFYETALGSEYGNANLRVIKWKKPIQIYVEHQVNDVELHDKLLNAHISDLKKITGLKIERSNKEKANIKFYFTSTNKLESLVRSESGSRSVKYLKNSVCMVTLRSDKNGGIKNAVIYIPVDKARQKAKLVSCIIEELTQALGLPRDSDDVYPSIFNDRSVNQHLTGLDIILLKILYSPEIKSGMTKSTLEPILVKNIAQLRGKGEIKRATSFSRSLEICKYLGC